MPVRIRTVARALESPAFDRVPIPGVVAALLLAAWAVSAPPLTTSQAS